MSVGVVAIARVLRVMPLGRRRMLPIRRLGLRRGITVVLCIVLLRRVIVALRRAARLLRLPRVVSPELRERIALPDQASELSERIAGIWRARSRRFGRAARLGSTIGSKIAVVRHIT